jgi:hypothetical protein
MANVFDTRKACCIETSGVKDCLQKLDVNETINIILEKKFETQLLKIAKDENCKVIKIEQLDNRTVKISMMKLKIMPRKTENCMSCGKELEYLTKPTPVTCYFCGIKELGYVICPNGHYICENCHGKCAYDIIKSMVLTTTEKDPLAIAEKIMSHPKIPMLGCEHAIILVGSLMAALRTEGTIKLTDTQILDAMNRTKKQAISGYCGLTGVCGVAIGIGAVFSTILGAACPKDVETSITMHVVARAIDAIANDAGPCCCKSFTRTVLGVGYNQIKEHFRVKLPLHREKISCFYSKRHPHGCRASKCLYYPKQLVK